MHIDLLPQPLLRLHNFLLAPPSGDAFHSDLRELFIISSRYASRRKRSPLSFEGNTIPSSRH